MHDHRPVPRWRLLKSAGLALGLLAALCGALAAQAAEIAPSARVTSGVLVRARPDGGAPVMGALRPGQTATLVDQRDRWYAVRLSTGLTGWVSKAWTDLAEAPLAAAPEPIYRIHVVDVGTGLAVFVEGPDFALVYDAGSNDDKALGPGNRMLAYLKTVRPALTTIDHMILSHPHQDHVLLLPDLLAAYRVRHVWDSGRVNAICGYRAFLEGISREPGVAYHDAVGGPGTRTVTFPAGCKGKPKADVLVTQAAPIGAAPVPVAAGATINFLHRDAAPYEDPNENSLVARLDLGAVRILLAGDAEAGERRPPTAAPDEDSVEAKLLALPGQPLRADILIVGHHGSKTSSRRAFLDAVGARVFVISSGSYAYSGTVLPDAEIVQELASRGALWRTDMGDGACEANPAKLGRDQDGSPGGCDNIVITIQGGAISVANTHPVD